MPVVRLVGEAIFAGEEACKNIEPYKMREAEKGNPVYYAGARREKLLAEFEAKSRALDADLAAGKERLAGLGSRIDTARAKRGLPDEIPPRSMMYQTYVCDLMW